MPRTVKKISVKLLVWAFKGLIGLKKCLTLLLFLVRKPLFWLYRGVLHPLLTLGYQLYRLLKKKLDAVYVPVKNKAVGLLANKYAIHVVVIVLTFLVTATNISASGAAPQVNDVAPKSVLATITDPSQDMVVVEETQATGGAVNEPSSLAAQAVTAQDSSGSDDGTDEVYDDSADAAMLSPIGNAVRVQPQSNGSNAPTTRTHVEQYVVQNGDTIGTIAQKFGLSVATVLNANKLTSRSVIRPGDKFRILPVDGIMYTTHRGDTLSKIANLYHTDVDKIVSANSLADNSSLTSGMELVLPGARPLPPPPPAVRPAPANIASNLRDIINPQPPADRVGTSQFLWPTAVHRITQYFHQYFHGRIHTGVDIAGPRGTSIYAADDGVVIASGWNTGGYGNMIIIDHGGGLYTRYGHASKLLVTAGQTVQRGDVIALMGSTGRSTGPHLHFEVMTGEIHHRVNPLDYIR